MHPLHIAETVRSHLKLAFACGCKTCVSVDPTVFSRWRVCFTVRLLQYLIGTG